jgi:hypothetical protein
MTAAEILWTGRMFNTGNMVMNRLLDGIMCKEYLWQTDYPPDTRRVKMFPGSM